MKQMFSLLRLFGFRTLLKRGWRHFRALPFIRGYATSTCIWTLLNIGFLDDLADKGTVDLAAFAREKGLDPAVLHHVCEYLDGLKFLRLQDGRCRLDARGRQFMAEPRGLFELLYGYEPVFCALGDLLTRKKAYKRDVSRHAGAVASGSGKLGRQLPFPVMQDIIRQHGFKTVLDIGCGNAELLAVLCEDPEVRCWGFDASSEAVECAEKYIRREKLEERISVFQGDMFVLADQPERWPKVEVFTAMDVFHEHLYGGRDRVTGLLTTLKKNFPDRALLVAEFCLQPHERLRRLPTAFLEHHLFHNLTQQVILSQTDWEELFRRSGYQVAERRIFNLVGHGYFLLK